MEMSSLAGFSDRSASTHTPLLKSLIITVDKIIQSLETGYGITIPNRIKENIFRDLMELGGDTQGLRN